MFEEIEVVFQVEGLAMTDDVLLRNLSFSHKYGRGRGTWQGKIPSTIGTADSATQKRHRNASQARNSIADQNHLRPNRSLSKSNASSHVPEEDLFDKDGHLFLAPHESCRLAFKYQCNAFPDDFGERDASGSDVQDGKGAGNERRTRGTRTNGDLLEDGGPEGRERSVKISLVACKDNWPADVREVAVCFRPLVVDRTFRFYQVSVLLRWRHATILGNHMLRKRRVLSDRCERAGRRLRLRCLRLMSSDQSLALLNCTMTLCLE